MANQRILREQDQLSQFPLAPGAVNAGGLPQSDVEAFDISVLDAETGSQIELISLRGSHRPFSPVTTPISQDIQKIYYPGNSNRKPTIQVMGPVDENVRLEGIFEAHEIREVSRREEPYEISEILTRICREGNICRFQIGPWIRFGFIQVFTPQFIMKSQLKWNMDLMIVGTTNPLQKDQEEDIERSSRIFATVELSDLKDVRDTVLRSVEEAKQELEETDYLPLIRQELGVPFSIPDWLSKLTDLEPVGRVANIGEIVYREIVEASQIANNALDELDRFINQVEQISNETTKFVLSIENLRSRLFRSVRRLYDAYSQVSSSLDTATRISSYNPISIVGGVFFSVNDILKNTEDKLRAGVNDTPIRIHVVKPTDTLQSISTRFYGDWERWTDIQEANNLESSDIQVDQILVIPE